MFKGTGGIAALGALQYAMIQQGRIAIRITIYRAFSAVNFRLPKLMLCILQVKHLIYEI